MDTCNVASKSKEFMEKISSPDLSTQNTESLLASKSISARLESIERLSKQTPPSVKEVADLLLPLIAEGILLSRVLNADTRGIEVKNIDDIKNSAVVWLEFVDRYLIASASEARPG